MQLFGQKFPGEDVFSDRYLLKLWLMGNDITTAGKLNLFPQYVVHFSIALFQSLWSEFKISPKEG